MYENPGKLRPPCPSLPTPMGSRSLIFPTPTPLLRFKNWLLLLVWLLITQILSTPVSI